MYLKVLLFPAICCARGALAQRGGADTLLAVPQALSWHFWRMETRLPFQKNSGLRDQLFIYFSRTVLSSRLAWNQTFVAFYVRWLHIPLLAYHGHECYKDPEPDRSAQDLELSLCEYKTVDTRITAIPGCTFSSAGAGVDKETNHSRLRSKLNMLPVCTYGAGSGDFWQFRWSRDQRRWRAEQIWEAQGKMRKEK